MRVMCITSNNKINGKLYIIHYTIRLSMTTNSNNDKIVISIELKGDAKEVFLRLKKKLNMENSSDLIRFALTYTEKRIK